MDVDELGDQLPLQVSVSPQTGDGDVVDPLISHWEPETAGQRVQGSISLTADHRSDSNAVKHVKKTAV